MTRSRATTGTEAPDSLDLVVMRGAVQQVMDEMDSILFTGAFSSAISEGQDASHGFYGPDGSVLAVGDRGLPMFVGVMPSVVTAVTAAYPSLEPEDIVVMNRPYDSGTHLSDIKMVTPVVVEGATVGYVASCAHAVDIGGSVPGGFNPEARDLFAEGLVLPPIRVPADDPVAFRGFVDLVQANSRRPEVVGPDLETQRHALLHGAGLMRDVFATLGPARCSWAMDELCDRSEASLADLFSNLTPGSHVWEEEFETPTGVSTIRVTLNVGRDGVEIDLTGSSEAVSPYGLTLPTTRGGVWLAIAHMYPGIAANEGTRRLVSVTAPPDTVINVGPTQGVGAYVSPMAHLMDAVYGAFSLADPDVAYAASYGGSWPLVLSGDGKDNGYVMLTWFGGGLGASSRSAGLSNGASGASNAPNPAIEVLEVESPIRFRAMSLRTGSGGRGLHAGGDGVHAEIEVLTASRANIIPDRLQSAGRGIAGGESGQYGRLLVQRASGESEPIEQHDVQLRLNPGDVLVLETAGGAGWGGYRAGDSG